MWTVGIDSVNYWPITNPMKPFFIASVSRRAQLFPRKRHRGFTLIITISLLVLLTMVAVGVLSLSAVNLRTTSQSQSMELARANARMVLMMALGDLQKMLGPDGRITSPAAQSSTASANHRAWVGVYDAWDASKGLTTRPSPTFQQWLSSSSQREAVRDKAFANSEASQEIPLVAEGSLGEAAKEPGEKVTAPALQVGAGIRAGKVAWWVGDESMKADVTSGETRAPFTQKAEHLLAANASPVANAEVLDSLGELSIDDPQRGRLISQQSMTLKNPKAKELFHDVTAESRGIPVDVTRKQLKYDFSIFAQQPRTSVVNLPIYKANGAINEFTVARGKLTNARDFRTAGSNPLASFANLTEQPGINMEELWIHANLYRNARWSGLEPRLVAESGAENKSTNDFRHRALSDPWYSYSKPVFASVQFVFSFVSKPDPAAAGKFRMQMQMDALVKVWNPNNVRVEIPAGSSYAVQLLSVPFKVQWNITNATGGGVALAQSGAGSNTYSLNRGTWASSSNKFGHQTFQWLRGNIGGLAQKGVSTGYTLEPGESKIFGHDKEISTANFAGDPNVNLSPGWGPGRQAGIVADFGASGLNANDMVEFVVSPDPLVIPTGSNRTYCNKWIGHRAPGAISAGGNGGLALGGSSIPTSINFDSPDARYFPTIRSSQRLTVAQYATPKPFMIFGHYMNVEKSSENTNDSFPSATRILTNTAVSSRTFRTLAADQFTASQEMWRADPLPMAYISPLLDINSRDQGRFGGSHSIKDGVTRCATRQLDFAPPLSMMSLTHAIANGFADRFAQASERDAKGLDPLQSDGLAGNYKFEPGDIAFSTVTYAAPQVERAIGNSFASPFVNPSRVTGSGAYHVKTGATVPLFDHSYLANSALFDRWFCSSLHDGSLIPRAAPYADTRNAAAVLTDFLANGVTDEKSRLLNTRVIPAADSSVARERLISGTRLQEDALIRLAAYVFLDGSFNVNSVRKEAWKAVLSTARDSSRRGASSTELRNENLTPVGTSGHIAAGMAKPLSSTTEVEQWSGFRALDDDQIDALATAMVQEVKTRGPFLSMADFLNRRPAARGDEQLMGAVQSAIEQAKLNDPLKSGQRSLRSSDFGNLPGAAVGSVANGLAKSAGIPGYVMQSDVLGPLINQMSVRGDTFRIRAYGSAVDENGKVRAEAWCEALVQRGHDYVDNVDRAELGFSSLTSPINRAFGRRFQITSFRWLTRADV